MHATQASAATACVDAEFRLVDPARNRFRLYGLTDETTLFGEHVLRIQWGRIGHRSPRERLEVFATPEARAERRETLVALRTRHGYVPVQLSR